MQLDTGKIFYCWGEEVEYFVCTVFFLQTGVLSRPQFLLHVTRVEECNYCVVQIGLNFVFKIFYKKSRHFCHMGGHSKARFELSVVTWYSTSNFIRNARFLKDMTT